MKYKLYDYDVHTLIDESDNEYDIINTMATILEKSIGQRFLIKWHDEKLQADDFRSIKNVRDYYGYVKDYYIRLKDMSCVDLKREILDMNDNHLKR